MRIDGINHLNSCFFNPREGEVYTFSAYIRANKAQTKVKLCFVNWRKKNFYKEVSVGLKWQKIIWTLAPIQSNQCGIYFTTENNTVVWVDAVQLNAGTKAHAYVQDDFTPTGSKKRKVPEVRAVFTSKAPNLDGSLNDQIWQKAAKVNLVTSNNAVAKDKTQSYLLYDNNNLYIGFRCYDKNMSKVRAKVTKRDGHVWNDDSVEIFIGPSGPRGDWADYYHLGVSITGGKYDAQKNNPKWNRKWHARIQKFADRWEAEIILPFAMFDLNKFNQGDWTFNLCRENAKASEYSCWSPTFGSFHKSDNFGILKALPKKITNTFIKEKQIKSNSKNIKTTPFIYKNKVFIPYGLAWQSAIKPDKSTFKQMHKAKMNTIIWFIDTRKYSNKQIVEVLNKAQKHNIKIIWWFAHWGIPMTMEAKTKYIKDIVKEYKKYPAILAWMVFDEPHSHADIVKACLKVAKKNDPADLQFYYLAANHTSEGRVGMLGRYLVEAQTMDIEWCFSKDGIDWSRPERKAWLPRISGLLGVYAPHSLVYHNEYWHMFYTGCNYNHNLSKCTGSKAVSDIRLAVLE